MKGCLGFFICYYWSFISICNAYSLYTLDAPRTCNSSVYLEGGPKSAAILKLTSRKFYDYNTPMTCTVVFMAPAHRWSGLTGFFEEVDLRGYEEENRSGHFICLDYVMVKTDMQTSPQVMKKNCGTWATMTGSKFSTFDSKRAVVGYCPIESGIQSSKKCHVTKLTLTISIGNNRRLSELHPVVGFHKGFTFVVSAYSYPTQNGESECREGLISCSLPNTDESEIGFHHCIHDSLWCDGHINCGFVENSDESLCSEKDIWRNLGSIVIGPWMAASFLLMLAFGTFIYARARRRNLPRDETAAIELNSYAESCDMSANPAASSHHMAIQVRVVCNSSDPHNIAELTRWKQDFPPPYDTLYPQGPPSSSNVTTSIIATVGSNAEASVNVSSVATGITRTPSTTAGQSNVFPSTIAVPLRSGNEVTSIIDLNVVQNADGSQPDAKGRSGNGNENKTSLTLTVQQSTLQRSNVDCSANEQTVMQQTSLEPEEIRTENLEQSVA